MRNYARQFKRQIEKKFPGCVLLDDGFVLSLEAPAFHTWDGDLHEFIAEYRPCRDDPFDPSLLLSAIADLNGRVEPPRHCTDAGCDWCHGE